MMPQTLREADAMVDRAETEVTFVLFDKAQAKALSRASALADFTLKDEASSEIIDRYFDSAGRALASSGWAYRLRVGKDGNSISMKSLRPASSKERRGPWEFSHTVTDESVTPPPGEFSDHLLDIIGEGELSPVAELHQTRLLRRLAAKGQDVANLAIDRYRSDSGRELHLAEVSLTALGTVEDLDRIKTELSRPPWGLKPDPRSRLEILFKELLDAAPLDTEKTPPKSPAKLEVPLGPDSDTLDFARQALSHNYVIFKKRARRLIESDDSETLHEARVALRRMRAAVCVFAEEWHPDVVTKAGRRLRRICRALGSVRDLDVVLADLEGLRSKLSPGRQGGLDSLVTALRSDRELALAVLSGELEKERMAKLGILVSKLRKTETRGRKSDAKGSRRPRAARYVVPAALLRTVGELRAYDSRFGEGNSDFTLHHQARIAAKRLRYAIEFLSPVLGKSIAISLDSVELVQDRLGRLNDAIFAVEYLKKFIASSAAPAPEGQEPTALHNSGPEVSRYLARRQKQIQVLAQGFPRIWARLMSPSFMQAILRSISKL